MSRKILVVGGTGPSGVPLVENFLAAGARVTVYHTGAHEPVFSGDVKHLHGDPRDQDDISRSLSVGEWDIAVCTSGRLRSLATALAGRVERFVGITGQPVYRGTNEPTPEGRLSLPIRETDVRQYEANNYTGKVAAGEDQIFEQHRRGDFEGVIIRYPGVYGPRGPLSHEWAIVKRVRDGRQHMILPHDGITYFQRGYTENLARIVFLAATIPAAAGEAFNAGDETVLSARHVAEIILNELGVEMQLVGVPAPWCRGAFPLAEKSNLILDMSKTRSLLGYKDVVDAETATRATARWLMSDEALSVRFSEAFAGSMSYAEEDRIIVGWKAATTLFAGQMQASTESTKEPRSIQ